MDTLSKTKNIMNKFNIIANKKYGQNFLIDDNILKKIIESAEITEKDLVIEIGPGLGNLTEYILNSAKFAILVEIDQKMIDVLNDRFKNYDNYLLINEDILNIDIDELVIKVKKEKNIDFENIKVVANLPYYITTPIIFKLLEESNSISQITVMVQKEVAQRMVAKSHSKEFGILTLMVEYFSSASINTEVPSTSFIPEPGVDSAVITLKKQKKYYVKDEKLLFELIHKSFAQRRKKMINSLFASNFNNMKKEEIEELFIKCNIDKNTRAEELKIEDYINLINNML